MEFNGIRIGTSYQDSDLSYCRADNTYTEIPIEKSALACPIEWTPKKLYDDKPMTDDEFFSMLFEMI